MEIFKFGNADAHTVLIQAVDSHDLGIIENEFAYIKNNTERDFCLTAFKVSNWNDDLSPWMAPAVFGDNAFGGKAKDTLCEILNYCNDRNKEYFIGGYSLAGLFSLWAGYNTDLFKGVAAVSPSVWFEGWIEYAEANSFLSKKAYLSLGDKEAKTRNETMAAVKDNIIYQEQLFKESHIPCILEWNEGNHFKDSDIRTAKGFLYLLNN